MSRAIWTLLAAFLSTAGLRAEAPNPETGEGFLDVEVVKDVPYWDAKEADPVRHKLDLYVPKGVKDFPVVMYVHGGSWRSGNKELYGVLGALFARNGVGMAVINYRLSNGARPAKHPDHIEDVARAFAWVHANIGRHGGRSDRLFVGGHSAGGHLVSLLATDESYLKAHKLDLGDVRGVLALSGVYTILPTIPLFHRAFGTDETICKKASPLTHVKGKHPPFFIAYADADFPTCDKMADALCAKLKECECEASVLRVKDRNHITIMVKLALDETDPCTKAIFDFISAHSEWKGPLRK